MTVEWAIARLRELRNDFADGESQLLQLERHRLQVQDSLQRVAGAIQVLEELVATSGAFAVAAAPGASDADTAPAAPAPVR